MKYITIDINKKVFDLVKQNSELKQILIDLGFKQLKNPILFNIVAKTMTLKKAINLKNIDIELLEKQLNSKGFSIFSEEQLNQKENRKTIIKELIVKLHHNEKQVDSIKKEFIEKLQSIEAYEVNNAIKELINENKVSVSEAKKYFYLRTLLLEDTLDNKKYNQLKDNYKIFAYVENQNKNLLTLLDSIINESKDKIDLVTKSNEFLNQLKKHYQFKETILLYQLKEFGNKEPYAIMPLVDNSIIEEFNEVLSLIKESKDYLESLNNFKHNFLDMVFKEENVLNPLLLEYLDENTLNELSNKYSN